MVTTQRVSDGSVAQCCTTALSPLMVIVVVPDALALASTLTAHIDALLATPTSAPAADPAQCVPWLFMSVLLLSLAALKRNVARPPNSVAVTE